MKVRSKILRMGKALKMVSLVPWTRCCSWRGYLCEGRLRRGLRLWGCESATRSLVDQDGDWLRRISELVGLEEPEIWVQGEEPLCCPCCRPHRLICRNMPGCLLEASPGRPWERQDLDCLCPPLRASSPPPAGGELPRGLATSPRGCSLSPSRTLTPSTLRSAPLEVDLGGARECAARW